MRYIIIYDITDDRLRSAVAKELKNYGLTRVQLSGFLGALPRHRLNSLLTRLNAMLKNGEDKPGSRRNIQVYPICNRCFSKRMVIGALKPIPEGDEGIVVI